jgi:hypothetical protein
MKQWTKPLDYVFPEKGANPYEDEGAAFNSITNKDLLAWMDKYCPSDEWLLDLTGGEPGLYPEIQTLIPELSGRGYRGIVRTNGTLPIPKDENFIRAAAWHQGVKEIPPYRDVVILFEGNPDDDYEGKKKYCEDNGVPYQTKVWVNFSNPNRRATKQYVQYHNKMAYVLRVLSMGQITSCHGAHPLPGWNIKDLSRAPMPFRCQLHCPKCSNIFDVERFMPEEWLCKR